MPLAALIAAQELDDAGRGLRAALPVAGRTLIEYQASLVHRAGAERITLLVERMPAELARAIERMRAEGYAVSVARTVADAVDRFDPGDKVLLVADGCVAAEPVVARLGTLTAPALLVVPDSAEYGAFERVDADALWAGFALVSGASLHATHAMLGDWDLISTVLRRAVQEDAARIDADISGEAPPLLALGPAALLSLDRAMVRRGRRDGAGWVARYVHRLVVTPIAGPLAARGVRAMPIALGSVVAAWLAPVAAAFGYFWPAAILLPVATAAFAVARSIGTIWAPELPHRRLLIAARHAAALVVLAMLALALGRELGWGLWIIAAAVPAGLAGLDRMTPIEAALGAGDRPLWLASGDALLWLVPPLSVVAGWAWMTAALALYTTGSFVARLDGLARRARAGLGGS